MGEGGEARPLPFLTPRQDAEAEVDESGKNLTQWQLHTEALNLLRSIQDPVAVVAITGKYRTGKSFLANRLLEAVGGGSFQVGSTVEACTKGIWIWGQPLSMTTADGTQMKVLFMDTEGLGSMDTSQEHDARVFALATLLCSYLVYNSVGAIDEDALGSLSFIANLSRHIQTKGSDNANEENPSDSSTSFPDFLWVLRDFTLNLEDEDGNTLTAEEYLDQSLETQEGFSREIQERNKIRKNLTSFFRNRDCVTLIRPLDEEDKLQSMDSLRVEDLRPEFQEQLKELKSKLFNKLGPKSMNGKVVTGRMLAVLAESYVAAINDNGVPNIEDAWQSVAKHECEVAYKDALEKYKEIMDEHIEPNEPYNVHYTSSVHFAAKQEALLLYQRKAMTSPNQQNLQKTVELINQYSKYDLFCGTRAERGERESLRDPDELPECDVSGTYQHQIDGILRTASEIFASYLREHVTSTKTLAERSYESLYRKFIAPKIEQAFTSEMAVSQAMENGNEPPLIYAEPKELEDDMASLVKEYMDQSAGVSNVYEAMLWKELSTTLRNSIPILQRDREVRHKVRQEMSEKQLSKLGNELSAATTEKNTLQDNLDEVKRWNNELKQTNSDIESRLEAKQKRVEQLQKQINELRNQVDELEEKLSNEKEERKKEYDKMQAKMAREATRSAAGAKASGNGGAGAGASLKNVHDAQPSGTDGADANHQTSRKPEEIEVSQPETSGPGCGSKCTVM